MSERLPDDEVFARELGAGLGRHCRELAERRIRRVAAVNLALLVIDCRRDDVALKAEAPERGLSGLRIAERKGGSGSFGRYGGQSLHIVPERLAKREEVIDCECSRGDQQGDNRSREDHDHHLFSNGQGFERSHCFSLPMILWARFTSLELSVSRAALAASRFIRNRTRLRSVINLIITPRYAAFSMSLTVRMGFPFRSATISSMEP